MTTPTTPPTPDAQNTPESSDLRPTTGARPSDSLADEMFVDNGSTRALPTTDTPDTPAGTSWATTPGAPASGAPATATATGSTMTDTAPAPAAPRIPVPAGPPEPRYLNGPAPFALVLGLLGLLVASSVLVNELTDITLPWGDLGPWSVVAAGLVVLLVGAIGLRSSRSRDTRA